MADLYYCPHGKCEPERGDCAECDKLLAKTYAAEDERQAKRELGEWAFEHPGDTWQHFPPSVVRSGHQARVGHEYGAEQSTKALAVLDALTKARATGGDRG